MAEGHIIKKLCRDCGAFKPLDQYNRTPTGRCKWRCAKCEDEHEKTAAEKSTAYFRDYHHKAMARKAVTNNKWMAFAMGDETAVDWGEGR